MKSWRQDYGSDHILNAVPNVSLRVAGGILITTHELAVQGWTMSISQRSRFSSVRVLFNDPKTHSHIRFRIRGSMERDSAETILGSLRIGQIYSTRNEVPRHTIYRYGSEPKLSTDLKAVHAMDYLLVYDDLVRDEILSTLSDLEILEYVQRRQKFRSRKKPAKPASNVINLQEMIRRLGVSDDQSSTAADRLHVQRRVS